MSADHVYSQNEEFFRDYDDAAGAAHHNEQLIQQQREERKMAYEPKDDTITLFMNDKKENERHPLMTGKGLVEGKQFRAAAWKNTSKSGKSYMTIKLSLPQDSANGYEKEERKAGKEIPF